MGHSMICKNPFGKVLFYIRRQEVASGAVASIDNQIVRPCRIAVGCITSCSVNGVIDWLVRVRCGRREGPRRKGPHGMAQRVCLSALGSCSLFWNIELQAPASMAEMADFMIFKNGCPVNGTR